MSRTSPLEFLTIDARVAGIPEAAPARAQLRELLGCQAGLIAGGRFAVFLPFIRKLVEIFEIVWQFIGR